MSLLKHNVAALHAGAPARDDDGLMAALGTILADEKPEPAFIALALAPPSEADIAREIGREVDPDAVFAARRKLRATIGERHAGALANTYERMITSGPYRPDAQSAGRRSLKNVCLDLLAVAERSDAIARAFAQYQKADNMTDRMAALDTLSQHDRPERPTALEDFYGRYADDPLIIDKWLALAGGHSGTRDTRPRARADLAPGVFDGKSQPCARAHRFVRPLQPHPVQPCRRRRLRLRGGHRDRARSEEPASGGAAHGSVPFLASA